MIPLFETNLLLGDKVRLTGLRKEDVATILKWREDTRFLRLWNSDPLIDRSESSIETWISEVGKARDEVTFGLRLADQEELIGLIGLTEIEWPNRVADIGIGIGQPTHWGKGYGTEATHLLVKYAFNELNLYRLQLTVFAYNTRAMALYERMGFRKEGTFRLFAERDGQRYDMYLYGLLRDEWQDDCTASLKS